MINEDMIEIEINDINIKEEIKKAEDGLIDSWVNYFESLNLSKEEVKEEIDLMHGFIDMIGNRLRKNKKTWKDIKYIKWGF